MHNLSFGLQKKLSERELVDIIKGNLKGQLATMLFSCTIFTLADLKKECHRAEKVIRDSRQKPRQIHEISNDFGKQECEASTSNFNVEAIGSTQPYKNPSKPNTAFQNNQNSQNKNDFWRPNAPPSFNKNPNQNTNKNPSGLSLCPSPFHVFLCFTCGMPVDYYSKNKVSDEKLCKSSFHKMKCVICDKSVSYCTYEGEKPPNNLNKKVAEIAGDPSQNPNHPEN